MDSNKNGKTFQMKSWVEDSDSEDESPKEINKIQINNSDSFQMNESEVQNILNNNSNQNTERTDPLEKVETVETVISIIKSVKGQSIKKKPTHEDICNVLRDAFRYLNNKDSLSFSTHLQNIYKNDRELIHQLYEIDSAYRLVNDLKPKNFKQQRTKKI